MMIWITGHPADRLLNRFADDELDPPLRRRVAAHAARCSRCRRNVEFIRRAGRLSRWMAVAKPPRGARPSHAILRTALARRRGGERVLLQGLAPPGVPSGP